MRNSFTAVLERSKVFEESFTTEPYEVGWACEARWFIRISDIAGQDTRLRVYPQISPDGLHWCDENTEPLQIDSPGLYSFPLKYFGHWLRIRCEMSGESPEVKVVIYLALKE